MEKFKRICDLIGVVLLLLLYLGTFIFSLMGSESAHMMFRACIAGTILIPVVLYAMIMVAKHLKNRR